MKKIKQFGILTKVFSAILSAAVVLSVCVACNGDDSLSRVKRSRSLKVGYTSCSPSDDAPFVMDGKGITAEPAQDSAKSIGADAVMTRLYHDDAYEKLLNGEVDCLWNVPSPSSKYVTEVRTIDSGIYSRQVIMTKAESKITRLADIKSKTLAVVSGSDAQAALDEASVMKSSLKKITICADVDELLELLESGSVDCAAVGEPQALYYIKKSPDKYKYIDSPLSEKKLVIAFRMQDSELSSTIAEAYVKLVQDGKIDELCEKYTSSSLLSVSSQGNSTQV